MLKDPEEISQPSKKIKVNKMYGMYIVMKKSRKTDLFGIYGHQ